ncbi:hypothetical protein HGRIS_009583 [Hohenbuehelia grisea]|uniref:Mediator of RNA polymerase II transcription subunit 20 n=1 Tax=Hohenbuehelia grisea TaxID=104357 RepID=A0ABR3J1R0_9AGAR
MGSVVGPWNLSIRSYRSTLAQIPGNSQLPVERNLVTLTMNENVFVLLEDALAPSRADIVANAPEGHAQAAIQAQPHYRTSFLTVRPPGALEQLLQQLRGHWAPVRHSAPGAAPKIQANAPPQLTIDGQVFAIGNDWIVRAGNVMLPGGAVKGMILEAEYLPMIVQHNPMPDNTSEIISNLIMSVLPSIKSEEAKPVAVSIGEDLWADVLWDREEEAMATAAQQQEEQKKSKDGEEDIYAFGNDPLPSTSKGDWIGVKRDRRSAYLILGTLRGEGLF